MSKFKSACLRNKGILFENDIIQIGSIINKISENSLKLTIFFGNKSNLPLENFQIQFFENESKKLFKFI